MVAIVNEAIECGGGGKLRYTQKKNICIQNKKNEIGKLFHFKVGLIHNLIVAGI